MNLSHIYRIGGRILSSNPLLPRTLLPLPLALLLLPLGPAAQAQDKPSQDPCVVARNSPTEMRTFPLSNVSQQNDANEIMVAIRNMVCPGDKVYLVVSDNAIVVEAPANQLALAQKLITDLDKPTKSYRLTYTITDRDASKTVGTQHFSMIVANGQHTSMKQGNKIPVATGSYSTDNATTQTQFTYLDIGMNFDSTINEIANGVRLQSKVEQSSLGESSTIAGVTEPVVRQTVLQGTSFLTLGKPVMLGSVDVPNTTHHFDIAVVLDEIK